MEIDAYEKKQYYRGEIMSLGFELFNHLFNLEKAVSRKVRKERKGESGGCMTLAFNLIGAGLCLHKDLNFFAALAPLREQMPFSGLIE